MEKAKKRRRRLLVLLMLAALMVWIGGCAAGQPLSLSALMTVGSKSSANGGISEQGPQTAAGTDSAGEVIVVGNAVSAEGGIVHGHLDESKPGGGSTQAPPKDQMNGGAANTPATDKPATDKPATEIPDQAATDLPIATETPDAAAADKPSTEKPEAAETAKPVTDDENPEATTKPDQATPNYETPDKTVPDQAVPVQAEPGKDDKVVALTFDDGPDTRYTTAILDILKEKDVKATFFVVGLQVSKNPDILKRIVDEGHAIGNHTNNHKDMSKLKKEEILEELTTADAAIKKAVGYTPTMFRAPYGAVSDTLKNVLKANDRELVGWSVDTRDWAGTSAADMRKMIKKETKPGGIILMHCFGSKHIKNTVQALPGVIDDLVEMGYSFVTADQLA